jgi:hypothetical protein
MRGHSALKFRIAAAALAIGIAQGSAAMAAETAPAPQTHTVQGGNKAASGVPAVSVMPAANAGELTTHSWPTVDPLIPVGGIIGLGLMTAALTLAAAQRRLKIAWLGVAGAGLTLYLANPELVREIHEVLPTEFVVVVDKSPSQTIPGREAATAAAEAALQQQASKLPNIEVRTVEAGNEPGADGTNLFGALDSALGDIAPDRIGGVFFLTDGQVHDVPAGSIPSIGKAPVHVLVSGREGETDRRLVIDSAPAYGLVNKDITVQFHVVDDGVPPGESGQANVTVTIDGKPFRTQAVTPGEPVKMTFEVPHGGANVIGLEVDKLAGELTTVNNSAAISVNGIHDRMRVLLISGAPNQSEGQWRALLKSDPATDLIHFNILRTADSDNSVEDSDLSLIPFPANELFEDKLDQFDLVIFDHYGSTGPIISAYLQDVVDYVNKGGSVLVATGPDYDGPSSLYQTPLAAILPAAPVGNGIIAPYTPQISAQGDKHPVTRNLGGAGSQPHWGQWLSMAGSNLLEGDVLMKGPDQSPLLILNHQGKGRVGLLLSNDFSLWARGYDGGGPYAPMLQQIAHWLIHDPQLEEEALNVSAQNGSLTVERQTMADKADPVTIQTPSGKTETLPLIQAAPGLWRVTVPAADIGLYKVDEGDKHAFMNVGNANPKEWADTLSTLALMHPVADRTGGLIQRLLQPGSTTVSFPELRERHGTESMRGKNWAGIRMSDAAISKGYEEWPLFGPWGLAGVFGLAAAAWMKESEINPFRRKTGKQPNTTGEEGPPIP